MQGSKHISLRAPEPDDLKVLYLWENDRSNWQQSGTLLPFSKQTLMEFLHNAKEDIFTNKQARFMIDILPEQQTVGAIDLFEFDPINNRAGVGILIGDTKNRNKGYAREALNELKFHSKYILHLNQLFCTIAEDNTFSIKLFEGCGFVRTGLLKSWIKSKNGFKDAGFYQCILE